ncbi:MAG TPA: lytic transglycosylase domain-containing protein [Solirubrobacterales bacterium]|jgi:soluble lytic murein transglycosylase
MSRARRRRRRLLAGIAAVAAGVLAGFALGLFGRFDDVIQELTLPLRHEDIIRQQSRDKDVDASLIAAVIYAESRFEDQTSRAGARGLMQITPATANEIERLSGGTTFNLSDLSDPDINIRYGTFYLHELLLRYEGNEVAALAAYNAGPTQVDEWGEAELTLDRIPLDETRGYVAAVLDKRRAYREKYAKELGY